MHKYATEDLSRDGAHREAFDNGIDEFLIQHAHPNTPVQRHLSTAVVPANDITSECIITVMVVFTPRDAHSQGHTSY